MESSVISTLCPREKGTSICWLVLFRLVWSGWECSVNVKEGRGGSGASIGRRTDGLVGRLFRFRIFVGSLTGGGGVVVMFLLLPKNVA